MTMGRLMHKDGASLAPGWVEICLKPWRLTLVETITFGPALFGPRNWVVLQVAS